MIEWRRPVYEDIGLIRRYMDACGAVTSDCSPVNIILLCEKYNIMIAEHGGFLYRKYTGEGLPGRDGIAYPVGSGDIKEAIEAVRKERHGRGKPLKLIYLTEDQCRELRSNGYDVGFETDRGNSDYLYTSQHLSTLSGRDNHKKKNRVRRFERMYPDCHIKFAETFDAPVCSDIRSVEDRWFEDQEERIDSAFVERDEIYEACSHWSELGLTGALVYTSDGTPVAMSIASRISEGYYDIHFEKCYGEYARAGGFAYINMKFCEYLMQNHNAVWINREEDIGLDGLRRAKMSYNPDRLLTKYHCRMEVNEDAL